MDFMGLITKASHRAPPVMAGGVFDLCRFGAGAVMRRVLYPAPQIVGLNEPCLAELDSWQRASGARTADTGGGQVATVGGLGDGEIVRFRHGLHPTLPDRHSRRRLVTSRCWLPSACVFQRSRLAPTTPYHVST